MKKLISAVCLSFMLVSALFQLTAQACTGLVIEGRDGSVVAARTLEFALSLHSDVIMVPRGYQMAGMLPGNKSGLEWTSKYAFVGANAAGQPVIVDGLNEKGLYFGLFFFPGMAKFEKVNANNSASAIAPVQLGNWLLSNFSSVEEVRKGLKDIAVIDFPGGLKGWGRWPIIIPSLMLMGMRS